MIKDRVLRGAYVHCVAIDTANLTKTGCHIVTQPERLTDGRVDEVDCPQCTKYLRTERLASKR